MKLFEKSSLGALSIRNRIVMPPMATLFGNRDGSVSSRLLAYYRRRSCGGVGLIIVENTAVHPSGVNYPGTLEIHSDRFIEGLARLASAIKNQGASVAIQLFHPGRQIHPKFAGNYPIGPSPVPCPVMGGTPKVLEVTEIHDLVKCFVEGAVRAKRAGFDAVEIHAAHGYLVAQFLSPFSNRRSDQYGGDAEGRSRFAVEICEGIRETLGDSFPILFRVSADEKVEGGLTVDRIREFLPYLEKAGVTAFHISAGCYPSMEWVVQPYVHPQGCLVDLARAVRQDTDLPLITVGRINDPTMAEDIVQRGTADLVSMGRALIADPDLPIKALEGRCEEIRPCIACNVCIQAVGTEQTRCAVNAEMGHEEEVAGAVVAPRRVLVVGGGPAGMEAALRARSQGHTVRLVETSTSLGGQLCLAAVPGSKAELRRLIDYYRYMIERSGIEVNLGRPCELDSVKTFHPDHIILATGAVPREFHWGAINEKGKAFQATEILRAQRVLKGEVVVVGGGPVGLDVADFLASKGACVTILEMKKHIGLDLEWNVRKMRLRSMKEKGVTLRTLSRVVRIEGGFVVWTNSQDVEYSLRADAVVAAIGSESFDPLSEALKGYSVTRIGDCSDPRGIPEAIAEGFEAARNLSGKRQER